MYASSHELTNEIANRYNVGFRRASLILERYERVQKRVIQERAGLDDLYRWVEQQQ